MLFISFSAPESNSGSGTIQWLAIEMTVIKSINTLLLNL